ncbi:MAG TPA: tRNA (guanosine(46)-N7)-methyltransferase TrmB [Propionibacteriaceae bacterium]|nr:tRNA (guanosine(46)-N7)-methyltransferase TrmB [Propionibacteriaceae bacterium]HPZ50140.1 tRNA (guanosine(46)-N7)-methyltransferase TrmB [Propionibacteriaceae bacterium]
MEDERRRVRRDVVSFVRRSARMNESQERAWAAHHDRYVVAVAREERSTSVAEQAPLDLVDLYGRAAPLIVEIGSGTGHALEAAAAARPDANHLAFEVFAPAVASTVGRLATEGLLNVRIVMADGVQGLTHLLARGAAEEIRIWFPDPWHKARHAKRRLVSAAFGDLVASRLAADGALRIATDWQEYADHVHEVLDAHPRFVSLNPVPRFEERPLTKYESRGIAAGRAIHDLAYRARP